VLCYGPVSVNLSQAGVLSELLDIIGKQCYAIAKHLAEIPVGSLATGVPNIEIGDFRQITCCISRLIQDAHVVSMD